ncbi:hypothetical protein [Acidaminobacterium chupaoyuni]
MKYHKHRNIPKGLLFSFVLFLVVLAAGVYTVDYAQKRSEAEWLANTESAVKRAVVSCYAIEGIYPPDIEYLREHYGLVVDESRYVIHYEAFASNIMPEIDVYALPK